MCVGTCHAHDNAYATYNDYYHGAAYKLGALDAPACWTCHGAHNTLALKDPKSMTSPEVLPRTCATAGCHEGASEQFVEDNRTLIHGRAKMNLANPIAQIRASVFPSWK